MAAAAQGFLPRICCWVLTAQAANHWSLTHVWGLYCHSASCLWLLQLQLQQLSWRSAAARGCPAAGWQTGQLLPPLRLLLPLLGQAAVLMVLLTALLESWWAAVELEPLLLLLLCCFLPYCCSLGSPSQGHTAAGHLQQHQRVSHKVQP
jgi:hypothetical protein